jgi:uncharacterized protein
MTDDSLFEFPCQFPIKIIGLSSPTFLEEIGHIVLKHFPDFTAESMTYKTSQNGTYFAITVTVYALNKPMLDAFYMEASKQPGVSMVL